MGLIMEQSCCLYLNIGFKNAGPMLEFRFLVGIGYREVRGDDRKVDKGLNVHTSSI